MMKSFWLHKVQEKRLKSKRTSPESNQTLKKHISKRIAQRETVRELYKKQSYESLVKLTRQMKGSYEEYDSIKVQGEVIKVGDAVLINSGDHHDQDYVGTIKQIISIKEPTSAKFICLCNIQWYMRKSEIIKQKPKSSEWISDQELFLTNHKEYILAQTIISKCKILSSSEYLELDEIESTVYFSRLEWDLQKKQFEGIDALQQFCVCQQPVNPDRQYIQCDICKKWFHFECVGVGEDYQHKEFYCKHCK